MSFFNLANLEKYLHTAILLLLFIIIKFVSGKIGCRKQVAPNQKSIKPYSPMNTTLLATVLINFPLNVNNGKLE